jgi:hypothetical protein
MQYSYPSVKFEKYIRESSRTSKESRLLSAKEVDVALSKQWFVWFMQCRASKRSCIAILEESFRSSVEVMTVDIVVVSFRAARDDVVGRAKRSSNERFLRERSIDDHHRAPRTSVSSTIRRQHIELNACCKVHHDWVSHVFGKDPLNRCCERTEQQL